MEPNTGIGFDDVAGVDEAKQDFEEVGERQEGERRVTRLPPTLRRPPCLPPPSHCRSSSS